jgi:hypothetical protein
MKKLLFLIAVLCLGVSAKADTYFTVQAAYASEHGGTIHIDKTSVTTPTFLALELGVAAYGDDPSADWVEVDEENEHTGCYNVWITGDLGIAYVNTYGWYYEAAPTEINIYIDWEALAWYPL